MGLTARKVSTVKLSAMNSTRIRMSVTNLNLSLCLLSAGHSIMNLSHVPVISHVVNLHKNACAAVGTISDG